MASALSVRSRGRSALISSMRRVRWVSMQRASETIGAQGHRSQVEPDWAAVHRELKRKHVTLSILWDEYIERNPEGYRYSRFCELYRGWEGKPSVTMRQTPVGGD